MEDGHITMALYSIRLYIFVLQDGRGEGVDFQGKFVKNSELSLEFTARDLPGDRPFILEGKSGRQRSPAFRALNKDERRHGG
jgi:hypothetical protein